MAEQLCDACESPHPTSADPCPIDPVKHHLAEIQRLDRELGAARLKAEELREACRTMDRECQTQLLHAGEDNEALVECISVLRAKLTVVERERDSWEASCATLRAERIKNAPPETEA